MSRNTRLVRLAAAVSAIAAIALAAATIENPLETGGGDGGFGPEEGNGVGQPSGGQPGPIGGGDPPAFLEYLVYAVVIVVAIALVWYLIAHRREAVKRIAVALVVVLAGAVLMILLFQGVSPSLDAEPPAEPEGINETGGGDPGSGEGETDSFSTGPLLFVLSVVTAIFVAGLLVSRRGGESESKGPPVVDDDPDEPATDAAAVAGAAGRAADRIDDTDTDLDNEIYRAWKEMTDRLEVDRPESSTPREFAAAAVEAGIDREHVDELTRLFEEVRYGDAETTPEMETRAVDVLRRIEDEYATADEGTPEQEKRPDGGTLETESERASRGDGR